METNQLKKFKSLLPALCIKLMLEISESDEVEVAIVGGTTRRFLLGQPIGTDFDVEVRKAKQSVTTQTIINTIKRVLDKYHLKYEEHSYNVYKLKMQEFDLELSLARTESYSNEKHHKNFEADYSYANSKTYAKRRDFSINAIYFVLREQKFVLDDPFCGVTDLYKQKLRHCSVDFVKDPVRALRMVRFAVREKFDIDCELLEMLNDLDLTHISEHYIRYEISKSLDASAFLLLFKNLAITYNWKLVASLQDVLSMQDAIFEQNENLDLGQFAYLLMLSIKKNSRFQNFFDLAWGRKQSISLTRLKNHYEQLKGQFNNFFRWSLDDMLTHKREHTLVLLQFILELLKQISWLMNIGSSHEIHLGFLKFYQQFNLAEYPKGKIAFNRFIQEQRHQLSDRSLIQLYFHLQNVN